MWAPLEDLPPALMAMQGALPWDISFRFDSMSCLLLNFYHCCNPLCGITVLHVETKELGNGQQQTDGS